jgi:RNA polymerase sigma factor (sigma-70 family)
MTVTTRSDAELLGQVRDGDDAALGELYVRHRDAALRLARSYGAAADAEDVVNEAFERVMGALRRGRGPADAFRPYLFVTVRRLTTGRGGADHDTLDEVPEAVVAAEAGGTLDLTERALVAEAFADLPDRWQTVLWHTAVEGQRPREVARAVGMPANTVAVLAHRARERLRQRYLQAHILASCP